MRKKFFSLPYFKIFLSSILASCSNTVNDSPRIKVTRAQREQIISIDEFENFPFVSGDKLTILPKEIAKNLLTTLDGHKHIFTSSGKAIRIPSQMMFASYKTYQIPEHLCVLTGAGSSTLDSLGKGHIESYQRYLGLWPEMTFLEIGCGIGRDVFQLLPIIKEKGKYIGIDVTRDSIVWLEKNISTTNPNFSFYHFDAWHQIYNPLGTKKSSDFTLPTPDHSVDRIALGSVFTHLFEDEIVHYLKEIKRVLAPKGLVYATFFLYEEKRVVASRNKSKTPFNLRFEHLHEKGCYINDPFYKTGAVAYTHETLLSMFDKAGLKLAIPLLDGSWSGIFPDAADGQEVAILTHSDNSHL